MSTAIDRVRAAIARRDAVFASEGKVAFTDADRNELIEALIDAAPEMLRAVEDVARLQWEVGLSKAYQATIIRVEAKLAAAIAAKEAAEQKEKDAWNSFYAERSGRFSVQDERDRLSAELAEAKNELTAANARERGAVEELSAAVARAEAFEKDWLFQLKRANDDEGELKKMRPVVEAARVLTERDGLDGIKARVAAERNLRDALRTIDSTAQPSQPSEKPKQDEHDCEADRQALSYYREEVPKLTARYDAMAADRDSWKARHDDAVRKHEHHAENLIDDRDSALNKLAEAEKQRDGYALMAKNHWEQLRDVAERQREAAAHIVDVDACWGTAERIRKAPLVSTDAGEPRKPRYVEMLGDIGVRQTHLESVNRIRASILAETIAAWPEEETFRSFPCATCGGKVREEHVGVCSKCGESYVPAAVDAMVDAMVDRETKRLASIAADLGCSLNPPKKDTGQPLCKHCGKCRDAHEDGFAGPGCPTGAGFFEPEAPPQPVHLRSRYGEGLTACTGNPPKIGQFGNFDEVTCRECRANIYDYNEAIYRALDVRPQPAEPQPAASGAIDEWTDATIDGAEKWGAAGATPAILFAALKRRNARIAELEKHNAELVETGTIWHKGIADRKRLRAKCARQRKELRRLNDKLLEERGVRRWHAEQLQRDLDLEKRTTTRLRTERDAAHEELRALKEREAPEDAFKRGVDECCAAISRHYAAKGPKFSTWYAAGESVSCAPYQPPRKEGSGE